MRRKFLNKWILLKLIVENTDLSIPFICNPGYLYFLPTHGGSNLGDVLGSGG